MEFNPNLFSSYYLISALPSKRRQIQSLVNEGRLEFTSGTWVMTDEATPHLYSMLDQMIEGIDYVDFKELSKIEKDKILGKTKFHLIIFL